MADQEEIHFKQDKRKLKNKHIRIWLNEEIFKLKIVYCISSIECTGWTLLLFLTRLKGKHVLWERSWREDLLRYIKKYSINDFCIISPSLYVLYLTKHNNVTMNWILFIMLKYIFIVFTSATPHSPSNVRSIFIFKK